VPEPSARELVERAAEARATANRMHDPFVKRTLLAIAESYQRLADNAAKYEKTARESCDGK
jgi:hypothetical protein